jgi:hypothetical protein
MKNISDLNICPLNEENLQALLDYFFPQLPKGDVKDLCEEIKKYDLTSMELEYAATKILPYISKIKDMLGIDLTQTNALDYSTEIFFDSFLEQDISPERAEIIKTTKSIAGVKDNYENLLGRDTNLFGNLVWN